ncbi:MAG: CBS domain-containing protein [Oscillospiraceae bacterium]|nr:CBS domain-containing protein [Oscillospiraceae bacterium]
MLVSDLMSPNVVSITPEESTSLAARLLYRHNIGALPVCGEGGNLCGIVTDRDIVLRCIAAENDPVTTPIKEIMSKGVVSVSPNDDARVATRIMAAEQVRRLPVLSDGKVVGMVSLGDLAKTRSHDVEASKALSEISANVKKK